MLYALAEDGNLYTVDMATGKATMKSKLETMLPAGTWATVDFNPAADRLRVIGSDGTSLRVNVDDGKVTKDGSLKFADGDAAQGQDAEGGRRRLHQLGQGHQGNHAVRHRRHDRRAAAAGAAERRHPQHHRHARREGRHGGLRHLVGRQGKNEAWLMAGDGLHSVDLATGKAGAAVKIDGVKGQVRDIAILPAM